MQEEGRVDEGGNSMRGGPRPLPRRAVVRSLSTMHMMGFTPLGFFETVSEGANLVEGAMSLPYAGEIVVAILWSGAQVLCHCDYCRMCTRPTHSNFKLLAVDEHRDCKHDQPWPSQQCDISAAGCNHKRT